MPPVVELEEEVVLWPAANAIYGLLGEAEY